MGIELPVDARCFSCGYALCGLGRTVCPECGRAFDPQDPTSFAVGREPVLIDWPAWAQPPGGLHLAAVAMLLGYILLKTSELATGSGPIGARLFGGPAGLAAVVIALVAGDYLLRLVACGVVNASRGSRSEALGSQVDPAARPGRRWGWRWLVLPLALAAAVSMVVDAWPQRVRFEWSRPALERTAQQYLAGTLSHAGGQWVGAYRVRRVSSRRAGEVRFDVSWGISDGHALAYDPSAAGEGLVARHWRLCSP